MDQTSTSRCAARGPPQRFAAAAARFRSSDAADQVHEAEKQLVLEYADKLIREGGVTVDMAYSVALETFFTESDDRAPTASPRRPLNSPTAGRRAVEPGADVDMGDPVARAANVDMGDAGESDDDDDDDSGDFDPYLFMKHLPPKAAAARDGWDAAHPRLGPRPAGHAKPVTLVLDLDETLVHSQMEPRGDADFVFDVQLCGVTSTVYAKSRPRLDDFLRYAAARFEVVIFTASHHAYAETLLDKIDPDGSLIDHRLFRDACATVDGLYLKDLDVLGRDLAKVAIVDNTPYVFGFQPDNAIPIESWYDDEADDELDKLKALLDRLEHAPDVRPLLVVLYRNEMHQTCHDRMKVGDYETDGDERHQLSHILCCDFEYRLTAAGFTVAAFLFVVGVHRNLGPIRVSLGKRQAVVIAVFAWVAAVGLCLLSVCDTCGRFEAYHMIGAGMFYVGGFGIMFATTATWRTVEGKCVCNYHSSLHWETDEALSSARSPSRAAC
ncbi:phosphoprotein phosphatase [Aureococcus anophagefferens]|nr:phosphoprotein phosphatase [Aureococcus anophagefferens]